MNNYKISKYTKLGFFEFYYMLKHYLNEDLWYLIYKYAMPNYEEGDIVLKDNSVKINDYYYIPPNLYSEIKIIGIYYHSKFDKYLYSYSYKNGICFYVLEEKLKKIESY